MNQDKEYKVDILRAIDLLDDASRQLTARTIADCLRHAGFPSDIQTSDVEDLLECDSKDDATEKKDLLEQRS